MRIYSRKLDFLNKNFFKIKENMVKIVILAVHWRYTLRARVETVSRRPGCATKKFLGLKYDLGLWSVRFFEKIFRPITRFLD